MEVKTLDPKKKKKIVSKSYCSLRRLEEEV